VSCEVRSDNCDVMFTQLLTITCATRKLRQVCNVAKDTTSASAGVVSYQVTAVTTERARRRRRQEMRVTAMLVTISMTFIVCQIGEPFVHSGVYAALRGPCIAALRHLVELYLSP